MTTKDKITIMAAKEKSYNCPEGTEMQVRNPLKYQFIMVQQIPKSGLDSLTSRITYFIRALIKTTDIISRTGLSYGFRDQCIDNVIWTWRSYKKLHKDWDKKLKRAVEHDRRKTPCEQKNGCPPFRMAGGVTDNGRKIIDWRKMVILRAEVRIFESFYRRGYREGMSWR